MNLLGTQVLVFGGYDVSLNYLNDLYAFDLEKSQSRPDGASWEILMPNESHANRPLARSGHTMVSWDHKLYL